MFKKFLSVLLALSLCLVFVGCSVKSTEDTTPTDTQKTTVRLGGLKGPTGMGMAKLLEDNEQNISLNAYRFTLAGSPDVLSSALLSGELDIAALPTNVAAVLYNKTGAKIRLLAVNTLGVLYVLSKDSNVTSVNSLKGKTVLASGKGTTAEYVFNYILSENGLTPGTDVHIEYASEHAEALTKALAGGYDTVLLPEPFVTQLSMKSGEFRIAVDLTKEWENLGNGALTMGCLAVSTDFLTNHPAQVESFLSDYQNSVAYVSQNTGEAAALIEKFEIAAAAVAQKALPQCHIVCITGEEMKGLSQGYFETIYTQNPSSVGGTLPGDDFYIP